MYYCNIMSSTYSTETSYVLYALKDTRVGRLPAGHVGDIMYHARARHSESGRIQWKKWRNSRRTHFGSGLTMKMGEKKKRTANLTCSVSIVLSTRQKLQWKSRQNIYLFFTLKEANTVLVSYTNWNRLRCHHNLRPKYSRISIHQKCIPNEYLCVTYFITFLCGQMKF